MNEKPAAFHSFQPNQYPMTIRLYQWLDDKLVWETVVDGPGAVEIPKFAQPVWAEVTCAAGTASSSKPKPRKESVNIRKLIERSSLGTPAAKALRASTTPEERWKIREAIERYWLLNGLEE